MKDIEQWSRSIEANIEPQQVMEFYSDLGRSYTVQSFVPGDSFEDIQPFDILLTRRLDTFMGKAIALFDGGFFSHSAIGYSQTGILAEALEWGVEVEHIRKYQDHFYTVIRLTDLTQAEKDDMQKFMDATLWANRNRYGYAIIFSIWLSVVTGLKIQFGDNTGSKICSGFDCMTLKSGVRGIQFPVTPSFMTPNKMARYWRVPEPSREMQKAHKRGYLTEQDVEGLVIA